MAAGRGGWFGLAGEGAGEGEGAGAGEGEGEGDEGAPTYALPL